MKKILPLVLLIVSSFFVKGQDMKDIEKDLFKSYNQIEKCYKASNDTILLNKGKDYKDSISSANDKFSDLLLKYTSQYPETLSFNFPSLKGAGLDIATSGDGKFRVYSWDNYLGGLRRDFSYIIQFQSDKVNSRIGTEEDPNGFFTNIYTLQVGTRKIYMGYLHTISGRESFHELKAFEIENGRINDSLRLFKTKEGLVNELGFGFSYNSVANRMEKPFKFILCEDDGKIVKIPIIDKKFRVTNKWITYQFNGQYFERVKKKKYHKSKIAK